MSEFSELFSELTSQRKVGGVPSFDSNVASDFRARVLIPQGPSGATITVSGKDKNLVFQTDSKPSSVPNLKDTSWTSSDKTVLKIDEVKGAWISGRLERDGKSSSFCLPVWFEVAP